MTLTAPKLIEVSRPAILWALHFIAVYALISAACAPRGLMETQTMRAAAGLVTLAAGVLALVWLVVAMRGLRAAPADGDMRPMAVAIVWSAAISLMAILANLWPVATLASCTG